MLFGCEAVVGRVVLVYGQRPTPHTPRPTAHRGGEAMQFGLQLNPYSAGPTGNPWDAVAQAAQFADESAFDSLWLYDHFLYEGGYPGHPVPEPVLECFTALGAVAA